MSCVACMGIPAPFSCEHCGRYDKPARRRAAAEHPTIEQLTLHIHTQDLAVFLDIKTDPDPKWRREGAIKGFAGTYYYGDTGWRVQHCGHPTALWRYLIHSPAGFTYVGPNGKAWEYIAEAKAEVERLHQLITAKRGDEPCQSPCSTAAPAEQPSRSTSRSARARVPRPRR